MQPDGLHLGSWRVGWYALMLSVGFAAGLLTALRRAPRAGVPALWIADIFPLTIFSALVGARLWHVVEMWPEKYRDAPWRELFHFSQGGLTYYGGFFGAAAAAALYARWRRISFWRLADVVAPSVALGYALTRVGCLMNGCCWGDPTNLPWAICFPASHPTRGAPVHPVQLYNVALNLLLYAALEWRHRHRRFEGEVVGWYLIGYGCVRFFTELFRGDNAASVLGVFTVSQTVSVALVVTGSILLRYRSLPGRLPAKHPQKK